MAVVSIGCQARHVMEEKRHRPVLQNKIDGHSTYYYRNIKEKSQPTSALKLTVRLVQHLKPNQNIQCGGVLLPPMSRWMENAGN